MKCSLTEKLSAGSVNICMSCMNTFLHQVRRNECFPVHYLLKHKWHNGKMVKKIPIISKVNAKNKEKDIVSVCSLRELNAEDRNVGEKGCTLLCESNR